MNMHTTTSNGPSETRCARRDDFNCDRNADMATKARNEAEISLNPITGDCALAEVLALTCALTFLNCYAVGICSEVYTTDT